MLSQGYNSHKDEDDPERIQMIIHRSLADADWILDKVRSSPLFTLLGIRLGFHVSFVSF